jgi:hypothetical protein
MPNLVRRPRPLRSPKHGNVLNRDPGTKLTYKERCRIFTLSDFLGWKQEAIATSMGLPRTTVQSAIHSMMETPTKQLGRKPKLIGQIRKRLVARATLDAAHRRMTYGEIAQLEGIQAGRKALVAAFKRESYHRRVATAKPLLTPSQKQARLAWAREHLEWTPEMWACVIWTDECCFSAEGFGKPFVTRLPEEKYLDACCVPKFKSSSSWTIHGSISVFGKGDLVIFEKEWGRITGTVYREHVLPFVYRFMEWVAGHPENH